MKVREEVTERGSLIVMDISPHIKTDLVAAMNSQKPGSHSYHDNQQS